MTEIGYQSAATLHGGLRTWASLLDETHESNPDLVYPKSLVVYDAMRSEDAQIGSVLRAVTQPILSTDWVIDPAAAPEEVVQQIAADLNLPIKGRDPVPPLRTAGRFEWSDHLRLALLELPFGHSFFEQVYRIEGGRVRLAKLAWRPQRTIEEISVAPDGGLISITQRGFDSGRPITIPVSKLVAYVNEREGANWVGRSLLRTAYKNWLLKDRLLRAQAITAERNGMGIPLYEGATPPETASIEEAREWNEQQLEAGLDIAEGIRIGNNAGVSAPGGAKFSMVGVTGQLPDTDKPIRYHDEQIARAVLAHFLNLGTETGSWALGSTFADFFTNSLNAVAQQIASVTQAHVVEDLVDLNWGPDVPAPRIVPSKIGAKHPATAESIKALIESGAIEADDALESDMRALYGLPVKDTATTRATPASKDNAKEAA